MMFNGYPVCPALTSLVLLASLVAAPISSAHTHGCSDIGRLYSPRILREVRARLMLAYAESHKRRTLLLVQSIEQHRPLGSITEQLPALNSGIQDSGASNRVRLLLHRITQECVQGNVSL